MRWSVFLLFLVFNSIALSQNQYKWVYLDSFKMDSTTTGLGLHNTQFLNGVEEVRLLISKGSIILGPHLIQKGGMICQVQDSTIRLNNETIDYSNFIQKNKELHPFGLSYSNATSTSSEAYVILQARVKK